MFAISQRRPHSRPNAAENVRRRGDSEAGVGTDGNIVAGCVVVERLETDGRIASGGAEVAAIIKRAVTSRVGVTVLL
jgi:hypothetical protein